MSLRLTDHHKLGRRVRCPKCSEIYVAQAMTDTSRKPKPAAGASSAAARQDQPWMIAAIQPHLDELQKHPEIRADFVESGRAKLLQGDYNSATAAYDAAVAFLK